MEEFVPVGNNRQMEAFGRYVCELRGDKSQLDIARAVGISRERLSQIENGKLKSLPDIEVLNGLARTLEVPVTKLLRRAGVDIPQPPAENLEWLIGQLDGDGQALLYELGLALLPRHRGRQGSAA